MKIRLVNLKVVLIIFFDSCISSDWGFDCDIDWLIEKKLYEKDEIENEWLK